MRELLIDDNQANELIKLMKRVLEKHNKTLLNNARGEIVLIGDNQEKFILNYFYSHHSKVIHLREGKNNYTLLRINLNNKFHKNANREIIQGNRINVFSEEEYYEKGDGKTHYKCYPLPFDTISNSDDFMQVFKQLLDFTKVKNPQRVDFNIQDTLFN